MVALDECSRFPQCRVSDGCPRGQGGTARPNCAARHSDCGERCVEITSREDARLLYDEHELIR